MRGFSIVKWPHRNWVRQIWQHNDGRITVTAGRRVKSSSCFKNVVHVVERMVLSWFLWHIAAWSSFKNFNHRERCAILLHIEKAHWLRVLDVHLAKLMTCHDAWRMKVCLCRLKFEELCSSIWRRHCVSKAPCKTLSPASNSTICGEKRATTTSPSISNRYLWKRISRREIWWLNLVYWSRWWPMYVLALSLAPTCMERTKFLTWGAIKLFAFYDRRNRNSS